MYIFEVTLYKFQENTNVATIMIHTTKVYTQWDAS